MEHSRALSTVLIALSGMGTLLFLLWIFLPLISSDFVSPFAAAGTFQGLTKLNEIEKAKVNEICGIRPGFNKINDGTIAKKGQFPWAVAIEANNKTRFCSGTIISQRHVLTAAHCVLNHEYFADESKCHVKPIESESQKEEMFKGIIGATIAYGGNCNFVARDGYKINTSGSSCEKDDMKRVKIRAVTWERRYRDRPIEKERCTNFDIAIIEVAEDFQWSNLVRPVCLLHMASDGVLDEFVATFYGFGLVKSTNELGTEVETYYPELRYGAGLITEYQKDFTITIAPKRMSSGQRKESGTSATCQIETGDSGGGILFGCQFRSVLIGITTSAYKKDYKTEGMQVAPHIKDICDLIGVCPLEICQMY